MQTLHGKTALITGAGKGLGKAMALALANEGVNLLLISRTLSDIEKVAAEVQALHPDVLVQIAAADISKLEEVRNALTTLTAENKKKSIS